MNKDLLAACGIDYQSGIARCLGDEGIYEAVLGLFLEDRTMDAAELALDKGDYGELFNCAHTMKGVSGNASMTELYSQACALTEMLRGGCKDEAEVRRAFAGLQAAYQSVRDGVTAAMGK